MIVSACSRLACSYAETHPEAVTLKEQIYKIIEAKSKKTVDKRYREAMALKEEYVARMAARNSTGACPKCVTLAGQQVY